MNASVETMIRTHLQTNDAVQETVEWVEIVARLETEPVQIIGPVASSVELRQRRWWPAAVAVAAVVVLVGGMALLFQVTEPDTPVITQPDPVPTTLPETTPTTVSTTPDPLSSSTWSRVPHDETVFGGAGQQSMSSVTVGGPGLVAVGRSESGAAVWTSVDGVTWSRVPHDEDVFGGVDEQSMSSVTAGGPGFVAVGIDFSGDDPDAAVWTSPDGITWSRVPHDESVFGGTLSQEMSSVTVGGPGLVAVGFDGGHDHMDGGGIEDHDAAVWTSVDGITWSRVPADDSVFGGPDNQAMHSVTVGGPGLVAVGWDGKDDWFSDNTDSAVWTSVDGITWSRVSHDESVFGGLGSPAMRDVTAGGLGLVAVGYDASNLPVWTSVNGVTWSRVPADDSVFGGAGFEVMESVTGHSAGLVAVGSGDDQGGAVWTSVDGITWTRVPDNDAVFGDVLLEGVIVAGSGPMAVGSADQSAAIWVLGD